MSTGPIAVMCSRRTRLQPVAERVDVLGEQLLQVGLDAVLDQPGVDPEVVVGVVEDLVQAYPEPVLGLGVLDDPHLVTPSAASSASAHLGHRAGRATSS